MDKPDLVVVCVVGDGEAETGPTATYVLTPRSFPLHKRLHSNHTQRMARIQIYRPCGIGCCPAHRSRQRVQDFRAHDLWHNGR
jgi:hypothetical protein